MSIDTKEWGGKLMAAAKWPRYWESITGTIVDLIRAVIADETPNIVKAMLNTPVEQIAVNLGGKTVCTYPVVPEGDVPEWCLAVAAEICVTFHDNEMIARKLYAAAEAELTRRVAEQTQRIIDSYGMTAKCFEDSRDKWKAFAENRLADCNELRQQLAASQAEVERLKRGNWTPEEVNNICHNLHGVVSARGFADGCALEQQRLYGCAPDADELARLREENARLSRPVEGEEIAKLDDYLRFACPENRDWAKSILQSERNAREAAEKRAVAAEAERDEWISACKELFDAPHQEHFCVRMNHEETQAMNKIRDLLAAHRAEKGKVTK